MRASSRIEQIAGIAGIALVVTGCMVVLRPFVSALLLAGVITYSTWPLYLWLTARLGGRRAFGALLMTALVTLVLVIPFVIAGMTLAQNIDEFAGLIDTVRNRGLPAPPAWISKIPAIGELLATRWQLMTDNSEEAAAALLNAFESSRGRLIAHTVGFGKGIVQMIFSLLISFFFYRDGQQVVNRVVETGRRIAGRSTQRILGTIGGTVKGVLFGVLGTALAQGILAGIGFHIAGVPSPFLLGLATFFLAIFPAGHSLVWLPAAIWLYAHDRIGWALFVAAWGFVIVAQIDNVLRPYLISRGTKLPFILVLLGVLGGLAAFGFVGIFLGPTLLAVGYALVKEFSSPKGEEPDGKPQTLTPDVP